MHPVLKTAKLIQTNAQSRFRASKLHHCLYVFSFTLSDKRMDSISSITPPLTLQTQTQITVHFYPILSCGTVVGRNFVLHNYITQIV